MSHFFVVYLRRLLKLYSEKNILWTLSKKELRLKYQGSKLGIWWAVIIPLLLALSINLIFTKAFKVSIPNFTLFVLSAILPWLFFSQGLCEATNSFFTQAPILKQGIFLREIIPLSSILGNFLNFVIGLAVLLPIFILSNFKILFFLPALIVLLIFFLFFLFGLSLIFSSANVFYRDVFYFLSFALMIWFWLTPIFYSLDMVPYPYKTVCLVNPLTYFMSTFRDLVYHGRINVALYLAGIAVSLVVFFVGYLIFIWKEKELLKRI